MRGDFQRKGPACSNLGSIVQKRPSTANWLRVRPANFKNGRIASPRSRTMSRDYRTTTTMQCMLQSRIDLAARPLQTKKSTFCVVLARPSSCNGALYRRRCSGRFSTPPDWLASYWRQRRSVGRSPDFCISIRMMPVATKFQRKTRVAMRDRAIRLYRDGTMREAQSAMADRRCE
jgi:hypothetical protein